MFIYFHTLSLFSFHYFPYAQIQKSFLKYNCVDTIRYEYDYTILEKGVDDFSLGSTFEEKHLWADLSFGLPLYKEMKFLPYLNISTGVKLDNFTGYIGYFSPILSKKVSNEDHWQEMLFQSLYAGITAHHYVRKLEFAFDFQLRKEFGSYCIAYCNTVDTSYISMGFTSKIGYKQKYFNPFLFLSLNSEAISGPVALSTGLGIALGNLPTKSGNYWTMRTCSNFQVDKPNIYLYPEVPCSVTVILNPDGRIIASEPTYENAWVVFASQDGTIKNTQGYLFYEAKINRIDLKNKGWCIKKDEIASFFFSVLSSYGFNRRESNDFVLYWKDHLPSSRYYIIYPIVNEEVDKVFPLTVYPHPDAVLRVWFLIESSENPLSLKAPTVFTLKRNGFVVTEWGVILK